MTSVLAFFPTHSIFGYLNSLLVFVFAGDVIMRYLHKNPSTAIFISPLLWWHTCDKELRRQGLFYGFYLAVAL